MDLVLCLVIYFLTWIARFAKRSARIGIGKYEEWTPGKKLKILLAGYNGARNTGSDVRVAAIARQLRRIFGEDQIQITVMALDPDSLKGYFDEDVVLLPFSSIYPLDLYRACCVHHAAILCEGSTLKSTFANALTLFMCEAAGIMASQGKPCIAYGADIGSMEPFLEKAARYLCRKTYFITRTESSLAALHRLKLTGHAGTDTAWQYEGAITREEADKLLYAQGWDGKKPLLGVAVIDPFCWPVRSSLWKWVKRIVTGNRNGQYDKWYFFSDSPRRRALFERYLDGVAGGIKAFLKKNDYYPVLIGMERLDETACRALAGRLGCRYALFLSGEYSGDVMTGILRRLSVLTTSRYHAAVLSMEGGCPIMAVSMDERLDGIMQELSLDREYLLKVTDSALGKKVYQSLNRAQKDRIMIRKHLLQEVAAYRKKQDEMGMFLKTYLEEGIRKNS